MLRYLLIGLLYFTVNSQNAPDHDIYWRDYHPYLPISDAVPVGQGLYVGQTIHKCALIPGTIYPEPGKFVSMYSGKFEKRRDIKIMCSQNPLQFKWESIDVRKPLPKDLFDRLVEGGYEDKLRLYVGRTFHEDEWRIGTVNLDNFKSLYMWNNNGSFYRVFMFDVLTYV